MIHVTDSLLLFTQEMPVNQLELKKMFSIITKQTVLVLAKRENGSRFNFFKFKFQIFHADLISNCKIVKYFIRHIHVSYHFIYLNINCLCIMKNRNVHV